MTPEAQRIAIAEAANAICGILLEGYRINVNAIDAARFGDIIQFACEKALQGEDELRRVASECSFEAGRGAAHASEQSKITKADIQTTGEKIPYFGHMRKKR